MRLEQQLGEHGPRLHAAGEFDEHAQRERVVDHGLPDVEKAHPGLRQDAGEGVRRARLVVTRDVDVEDS